MGSNNQPTISYEGRADLLPDRYQPTGMDRGRQRGPLMLVLVAGADLDYCTRLGDSLRRDSHQVVLAGDFEACRHFAEHATADAMIMSASDGNEVPADLIRDIRERQGIPIIVLVDDASPDVAARYVRAGAECHARPADPDEIAGWMLAGLS